MLRLLCLFVVLVLAAPPDVFAQGLRPIPRPEPEFVSPAGPVSIPQKRPVLRDEHLPRTRWEYLGPGRLWTRTVLSALKSHGAGIEEVVPKDIDVWCPAYPQNPPELRRAFWVGMISALAKHESTYRETAVGGGDLWYGLLQILPATARGYGCHARSGTALKDGTDNLACAVRIMAVTVPRDEAVATKDTKWRGVAADWGPMVSERKRNDMARYTRRQTYCRPLEAVKPLLRPAQEPQVSRQSFDPADR